MKSKYKIILSALLTLAFIAWGLIYLSGTNIEVLNPKGMVAREQKDLLVNSTLIMLIVVVPVFIITLVFAWKYRVGHPKTKYMPEWHDNPIAETIWWGLPFVIVIVLSIWTWTSSHSLDPFKPIENGKPPVTIQVVALEWKWLFIYPEEKIASVNYFRVPVGHPINFDITSDAPMNSFWIPQLGGQIYAMSGMRSKLHLIADEEGSFNGSSANISGKGFAGMRFIAQSSSEDDFQDWVKKVKKQGSRLDRQRYAGLAEPSENNPVSIYVLSDEELFDWIIMKYMRP